jgi:hypothetical protein
LSLEIISPFSFCCLFLSFFLWCCLSSLDMDALEWRHSNKLLESYLHIHQDKIIHSTFILLPPFPSQN